MVGGDTDGDVSVTSSRRPSRADGLLVRLGDADRESVVTAEVRREHGPPNDGGGRPRRAVELDAQDEVAADRDLADVRDGDVDADERVEERRGDARAVLARHGDQEAVPSDCDLRGSASPRL